MIKGLTAKPPFPKLHPGNFAYGCIRENYTYLLCFVAYPAHKYM